MIPFENKHDLMTIDDIMEKKWRYYDEKCRQEYLKDFKGDTNAIQGEEISSIYVFVGIPFLSQVHIQSRNNELNVSTWIYSNTLLVNVLGQFDSMEDNIEV